MTRNKLLFIVFILIVPVFVSAENLEETCNLNTIENQCNVLSATQCRVLLEKCEQYYSAQSDEIAKDLNKTEAEKKTLENKIYSLNKKVKNLSYQISQSNVIIKDLGIQIEDTTGSIVNTESEIDSSKRKLGSILRSIYEEDQKPIVEILLAENSLSGFFDNLALLESLTSKNKDLLQNIKDLKINLEDQKVSLDEEKEDLENMVEIQTVQKQQNSSAKKEQEYYLEITEEEYQKYLGEKETVDQKASEVRARIFELIGVSKAPTFGEAYEIAKYVESITGVRPAFLLAVLTQESNIGKNVGQCYLSNSVTGAGQTIKSGRTLSKVMKPTRDVQPFLTITKELGRDPYMTPVSCPMSYGWGGAMGPAQFIPATWMIYRDELKEITGSPADPWDIKDAFLAAGLYLSKYGAQKQTYDGEFNAALSYFAGPGWYNSSYKSVYQRDYGYPIMAITKRYESDIAKIK
ncbi:lytic murein transglycosylase [Patescibacteria group bacterium]|nr:lytic murein transglycosylase [Patescibacteria group bacterium]